MPRLVRWNGKEVGEVVPLSLPATIGRHPKATCVIHDTGSSRYHTKIVPHGRGFVVLDLDSRNGTLLNNRKVKKAPLVHGDVIRIGATRLTFVDDRGEEWVGRTLDEFEIRSRLDRFAVATDFLAHQPSLDREVTLSLLDEELTEMERDRLVEEARACGRLRSASAGRVFDVVEADGRTAIVSEPPHGVALGALPPDPRARPLPLLVDVAIRICEVAEEAHAAGITLKGLDSGDVFIGPDGHVKVARIGVGPERSRKRVISPEEKRGAAATPASDVYTIARLLVEEAGGMKAVSEIGDLIGDATGDTPRERYATPRELADALRKAARRWSGSGGPGAGRRDGGAPADDDDDEGEPIVGVTGGLALLKGLTFVIFLAGLFLLSSQVTRYLLR